MSSLTSKVKDGWARWKLAHFYLRDVQDVDVSTTLPTSGQALVWNSTDSKWEPGSGVLERVPFSYAGALALSTSPPWAPVRDETLTGCRALLGTAGTSSTVVTVYVNGVSKGTVTLTSGQTNIGASLTSTALAADTDLVTVGVTTVGTGAKDLTVLVRVA